MDKLDRPRGLIRYSSQDELAGKPRKVLRIRTFIYPALLVIAASLLVWQLGDRPAAEVWVLRLEGQPFATLGDGRVQTQLRLRVENRTRGPRHYSVDFPDAPDLEIAAPRAPVEIAAGASEVIGVIVFAPAGSFHDGERRVTLRVRDDDTYARTFVETLLGPDAHHPPAPAGGDDDRDGHDGHDPDGHDDERHDDDHDRGETP